jgi:predicted nucleic acid-binding Zn ribbon protein
MKEPPHDCEHCDAKMIVSAGFPCGTFFRGAGFHCVDYPKSAEQLKKDYGLDKHDSTNEDADYHQDGYAEHMADGQEL